MDRPPPPPPPPLRGPEEHRPHSRRRSLQRPLPPPPRTPPVQAERSRPVLQPWRIPRVVLIRVFAVIVVLGVGMGALSWWLNSVTTPTAVAVDTELSHHESAPIPTPSTTMTANTRMRTTLGMRHGCSTGRERSAWTGGVRGGGGSGRCKERRRLCGRCSSGPRKGGGGGGGGRSISPAP